MDYQLSHAYEEAIKTRDALEKLAYDITGAWPMQHQTPAEIADAIRDALRRQRRDADAGQRGLFDEAQS